MNFSCGVTFDLTLVLTHWILTLAIQGLRHFVPARGYYACIRDEMRSCDVTIITASKTFEKILAFGGVTPPALSFLNNHSCHFIAAGSARELFIWGGGGLSTPKP